MDHLEMEMEMGVLAIEDAAWRWSKQGEKA
jgi:hypothetical protein